MSIRIVGAPRLPTGLLVRSEGDLELRDDLARYVVLQGKYVGEISIIPLGPDVRAAGTINELGIDANHIANPPHASF
jgi:hypothetical protein